MTKAQIRDAQKCEEFQEQGINMDCLECSCNCCMAQQEDMFSNKELLLIKYALLEYKANAQNLLLTTNKELDHSKAMLDVEKSNELLKRVKAYLGK